jgi:hypothetical protein
MESPIADAVLPQTSQTSDGIAAEGPVSVSQEDRFRRVLDYQVASLAKPDPLQAVLGSLNCGVMHYAMRLEEIIDLVMASGPRTVEGLQKILPAIDTHLRATRQVERLAQFELRAGSSRQPQRNPKAAAPGSYADYLASLKPR